MGNPDECSDHKIIDKRNSCYGFDNDGKFCDVWYLMKQKYPHIEGMEVQQVQLSELVVTLFKVFHNIYMSYMCIFNIVDKARNVQFL